MAEEKAPSTIFNKAKNINGSKGGGMKSASWVTPKPEKEEEATEAEETIPEDEIKIEEELTEEEKLWKKYKNLAAGSDNIDNADTNENAVEDEEAVTQAENEDEEASSVGMNAILDDYKKSQQSKGKMNSRSFGKID